MAKYKNWYRSKTIWMNVFVVLAGVFTALAADLAAGTTITAIGCLNLVLRLVTNLELV